MEKFELFENERATAYDSFVKNWIPNYNVFLNMIPHLFNDSTNDKLLAVGCGTGNEILVLKQNGYNGSIMGIDPSPEMIAQATHKLKDYEDIVLKEVLVSQLTIDHQFNAATLILVLHFLKDDGDKLDLLRDISIRLEPKALLIMLDITGNDMEIRKNLEILEQLLPPDMDQNEIAKRLDRIYRELHHVSEQRIIELFTEAGFEEPTKFFQSTIYMGWMARKKN